MKSLFKCRVIQPAEFTSAFENYVFRTFICAEPMSIHLGLKEPDECIMLYIRKLLQRAKEDKFSLGIYDETDGHNQYYTEKVSICMSSYFKELSLFFI